MAKRAKDSQPYRPVHTALVAAVLDGGRAAPANDTPPEVMRAATYNHVVERQAPPPPPPQVVDSGQLLDPSQRLTREKRYLLSPMEEDRIEDLVRSVARELKTPLKLSHLVRAAVYLITRCQAQILSQAREKKTVTRPPNGDTPGLARFETELAKLLDGAFRLSPPLKE